MKINFKKRFGQNFLVNDEYIDILVQSADITETDTVLEVGSGHGAVTEELLKHCRNVFAVEIDSGFIKFLKSRFIDYIHNGNLKIFHSDILLFDISEVFGNKGYKVLGSLPYNISKKIIMKFLEAEDKPTFMSFVLQKEVAENYSAVPPKATFLSNYAKVFSKAAFVKTVPKESFKPIPKVDGGIITFEMKKIQVKNYRKFIRFLKSSFMMPRKMLVNNLSGIYRVEKSKLREIFHDIGLNENARASVLGFNQWVELYNNIRTKDEC